MILFLDFDGVLHPSNHPPDRLFEGVPRLAAWLSAWPQVHVVISSSWRRRHTQRELAEMLGDTIGPRVIGCTSWDPPMRDDKVYPSSKMRTFSCERQKEVEEWMKRSCNPARAWVSLDDMRYLFNEGCERLVVCDGRKGLSLGNIWELDRHAEAAGLIRS